jgi:hypothetical protein
LWDFGVSGASAPGCSCKVCGHTSKKLAILMVS